MSDRRYQYDNRSARDNRPARDTRTARDKRPARDNENSRNNHFGDAYDAQARENFPGESTRDESNTRRITAWPTFSSTEEPSTSSRTRYERLPAPATSLNSPPPSLPFPTSPFAARHHAPPHMNDSPSKQRGRLRDSISSIGGLSPRRKDADPVARAPLLSHKKSSSSTRTNSLYRFTEEEEADRKSRADADYKNVSAPQPVAAAPTVPCFPGYLDPVDGQDGYREIVPRRKIRTHDPPPSALSLALQELPLSPDERSTVVSAIAVIEKFDLGALFEKLRDTPTALDAMMRELPMTAMERETLYRSNHILREGRARRQRLVEAGGVGSPDVTLPVDREQVPGLRPTLLKAKRSVNKLKSLFKKQASVQPDIPE